MHDLTEIRIKFMSRQSHKNLPPCDSEERRPAGVPELEPDLREAGLLHVGEGDEVAVAEVEAVPRCGATGSLPGGLFTFFLLGGCGNRI